MGIERRLARAVAAIGLASSAEACTPDTEPKHHEPTHLVESDHFDRAAAIQELVQSLDSLQKEYEDCLEHASDCNITVNSAGKTFTIDFSKVFRIKDKKLYVMENSREVDTEEFARMLFLKREMTATHEPITSKEELGDAFWTEIDRLQQPEPATKTTWMEIKK